MAKKPNNKKPAAPGRTKGKGAGTGESSKNRPGESAAQRRNKAKSR
jgi:hypothetical protein